MGKIIKTIASTAVLICLFASCGTSQTEPSKTTDLPKTDQPSNADPARNEVITDLSGPIWIGKSFELNGVIWKFSNYKVLPVVGDVVPTKEMFYSVDVDIDEKAPLNFDAIRLEMVDVFGNRFQPTTNQEAYKGIEGRIPFSAIPTANTQSHSAVIIFEGPKATQGVSIEILDKTSNPEKRLALIDMGV
jgi:hypothetical protein